MKGEIEARILRDFANIFRKLGISDIRVEMQPDGWYSIAICPENVRLAEVLLTKSAWKSYDFPKKTFGIDVDRLYKFASDFKKGEILEIVFSDTREMKATFYLNGTLTRTFTLPDPKYLRKVKKPALPKYKTTITLLTPQVDAIKNILTTKLEKGYLSWERRIGIGVVERAHKEYELCLYAEDDEGIKNKICAPLEYGTNYIAIEPCAAVYNFDYFKSVFSLITKEVVATRTVTIQFAFEHPFKMSYEYEGIKVEQILLAPVRVHGEEEKDVYEELQTPLKPVKKEEEEIARTETTLYFVPTAKGRLLKPFRRKEYSIFELIDILLEIPRVELEGLLSHLKLEAIWKKTSYDKYGTIVKEEEISREPANSDAIIMIIDNYDLIREGKIGLKEAYEHPEKLPVIKERERIHEKEKIEKKPPEIEEIRRKIKIIEERLKGGWIE